MQWLILFLIGLGLFVYFTLRTGRLKFWKLVCRNPEKAYKYFKNQTETWMVLDINMLKDVNSYLLNKNPNYKEEWAGPYRLFVPSIGDVVHIYGRRDTYIKEQDKLISMLKSKEKEVLKK